MDERKDATSRSRDRRNRLRFGTLRGPACLVALLAVAAIAATTTRAQDAVCDPATGAGCTTTTAPESPPPPPEQPPPPPPTEDPPPAPKPSAPAPTSAPRAPSAPADAATCSDGTPPPCAELEELERSDPAPTLRSDCRRRLRPGEKRPKRCRRRAGVERGDGDTKARRRAARKRREAREQCERLLSQQVAFPGGVDQCSRVDDLDGLTIAGQVGSRPLPDPIAPGSRLDAGFARLLRRVAGSNWPLVLAMLRAEGKSGPSPASAATLGKLARRARGTKPDERVDALADYHRAVGLEGLTRGMHAVQDQLASRVVGDGRIGLYPGGRFDVGGGRIDVRVLVAMLYLAERHGGITVTSLISGHGVFTKSGHVSLHSYGQAVDIAAVGGVPVIGNQQPGGATETALRSVMLLPAELRPSELISLFSLGGPSFAMADHADHIHIGF